MSVQWQARAEEHCQDVYRGATRCVMAVVDGLGWWVESSLLIGQLIKRYARRRVVKVVRRVVRGTATALAKAPKATRDGICINTAYIAIFRSALAPLARRDRAIADTEAVLTAGTYLAGCAYNLCCYHDSLRLATPPNAPRKWEERTPAMAAGLTDHPWTLGAGRRLYLDRVRCQ